MFPQNPSTHIPMNKEVIVFTTCDDRQILEKIAYRLVEDKLSSCCQIHGPLQSVYRWEGNVQEAQEWSCSIKTTLDQFDKIENTIRALHSYDEPEIVAVEIVAGSEGYLKWLREGLAS